MDQDRKNFIYDRLLAIRLKIEAQEIPSPYYVNGKIGECHVLIEEVERYSIETSKEISVISQALNNSMAEYETKKETLLQNPDIGVLPTIKEREARANMRLREELGRIKSYRNEQLDLNNLLKAINLKIKDLTRANADIKMQLRILDAQIKLGGGPDANAAMRSLSEEFKKSISNEDVFGDSSAETSIEQTEDPSEPLDVDNLLKQNVAQELVDPVPYLPDPDNVGELINPAESYDVSQEAVIEVEKKEKGNVIDLDSAIDFGESAKPTQEGGTPANEKQTVTSQIKSIPKEQVAQTQKESHPKKEDLDLDALLDSIITHN